LAKPAGFVGVEAGEVTFGDAEDVVYLDEHETVRRHGGGLAEHDLHVLGAGGR